MLVLTRKIGERILIGGNIELTVLKVGGHRVRLGVVAPAVVPVDRAEIAAETPVRPRGHSGCPAHAAAAPPFK
jgi:carbon storage regulator